jgi:hypothetical protein
MTMRIRLRQELSKDLVRNPHIQTFVEISSETLVLLENVSNHVHISNQPARSSLVLAQTSLTAIITDLKEHTGRFSLIRKEEASKNEYIEIEANRLKRALKSKSGFTNYILTMDPDLEEICALLEREADSRERGAAPTGFIQNFLQELDTQDANSDCRIKKDLDVDAEISHAWCLDQIAILLTHESGLDQVIFCIQKSGFTNLPVGSDKYFLLCLGFKFSRFCTRSTRPATRKSHESMALRSRSRGTFRSFWRRVGRYRYQLFKKLRHQERCTRCTE